MLELLVAFAVGAVAGGATVFLVMRNNKHHVMEWLNVDLDELKRIADKAEGEVREELKKALEKVKSKL